MLNKILISTALIAFSTNSLAGECGRGEIYFNGGIYKCTVNQTITDLENSTFGIVKSAEVKMEVKLDTTKIPEYLSERKISLPPQEVSVNVITNGTPIQLLMEVTPEIGIEKFGSKVKCTTRDTNINIDIIDGNLASWVLDALDRRVDQEVQKNSFKEKICKSVEPLLNYI